MFNKEIVVRRYQKENKDAWNDFVKNSVNGVFMFDRDYMDYHSDRFDDHSLLFFRNGELVSVMPANDDGYGELYTHQGLTYGGFVFNEKMNQHVMIECFVAWFAYLEKAGFKKVLYKTVPHIFHAIPAEEDIYLMQVIKADTENVQAATVLDLNNSIRMPKGRKAQINRSKREGVEIYERTEDSDYQRFFDLENQMLEEYHGARTVHTADEMILLHNRFPSEIKLYTAEKKEQILAGAVIYEYTHAIHTQYLGSFGDGRTIGALDHLISEIMKRNKNQKRWLDFGTSSKIKGRGINIGLISQKEGFGGRSIANMAYEFDVRSGKKALSQWIDDYIVANK